MGACASVAKAMRGGDAGAAAPPPEQPTEETIAVVETATDKEIPAGETSEIVSEEPKETPAPKTTAPPEAEATPPANVEEKVTEAKVE